MKLNQTLLKQLTNLLISLSFIFLPVQKSLADHAQVLTPDIEFSCDQMADLETIKCAYRFVEPDITKKISATLGNNELPIQDIKTYPFENSTTSILFLVDSSESDNTEQIEQIQHHIVAFSQQALSYQEIGLATFDANLKILKPLGSDPEEIIQIAEEITATDQPTELYRSILDALKLLKTSSADRKALYVFSSGESEDQATYHRDVIKSANETRIKIISIAYPMVSTPTDTTQTLRRLSKDSGGIFVKATEGDFELPESFLSDPFAAIDNGGVLNIDLTPALTGDLHGMQVGSLVFETSSKRITIKLPLELSTSNHSTEVHLKGNTSAVLENDSDHVEHLQDSAHEEPILNEKNNDIASTTQNNGIRPAANISEYWPIIPIGLILLGLSTFIFSKNKSRKQADEVINDGKPLAWLVSLTDDTLQHPVYSSPWKIGRTRENDLFLEHSSVSRKHAEFKRNRDGSFTIVDLDSLNGVYVNNTKVSTGLIKDHDKIDIGDIRLQILLDLKNTRTLSS